MGKVLVFGLLTLSVIAAGAFAGVASSPIDFGDPGDSGTASLSITGGGSMTASGTIYVKILLWWYPINVNFSNYSIVLSANPEPTEWASDPTGTGQVGFERGDPPLGSGTVNALNVDIKDGAAWNLAMNRITLTDPGNDFQKFYLDMTGAINSFRFDMTGPPSGTYNSGEPPTVTYDISPSGTLTTSYSVSMSGNLSVGITVGGNWYAFNIPLGSLFTTSATVPLPKTANGTMTLTESSGRYPHDVGVDMEASIGTTSLPFGMSDVFTISKPKSGNDPYYTLTGSYTFSGLMQIRNTHFEVSDTIPRAVPDPYPVTLELREINGSWGDIQLDPPPEDPEGMLYSRGTVVTLTAIPIEGKSFREWTIYDPNHPWDANYAVTDSNNPITVVMDTNQQIEAAFKCGSGVGDALPLLTIGLLGLMTFRRGR